jgi:hypothetical protein
MERQHPTDSIVRFGVQFSSPTRASFFGLQLVISSTVKEDVNLIQMAKREQRGVISGVLAEAAIGLTTVKARNVFLGDDDHIFF